MYSFNVASIEVARPKPISLVFKSWLCLSISQFHQFLLCVSFELGCWVKVKYHRLFAHVPFVQLVKIAGNGNDMNMGAICTLANQLRS